MKLPCNREVANVLRAHLKINKESFFWKSTQMR